MTITEMWELYDKYEHSDVGEDILEMIMSIEEIYETGVFEGFDIAKKCNSGSCFVYFISSGEAIKIGVSNNVPERLKTLQTANGSQLKILHVIPFHTRKEALKKEVELHEKYKFCALNGEWFDKNTVIHEEFLLDK